MLWCALRLWPLCPPHETRSRQQTEAAAQGVALWALQFTPRVALCDEAVLMEVQNSLRLFGGACELAQRVRREGAALGVHSLAWAPTALGALALARAAKDAGNPADAGGSCSEDVDSTSLAARLDPLPLTVLSATAAHAQTLAQLGCHTLGDLRCLPRGGLTRRFGASLVQALDEAYGLRHSVFPWVTLPETFCARLDLMARVETALALVFAARRLLLQLQGWLVARDAAVTAFTLRWQHDSLRENANEAGNALVIRTARPLRDVEHLARLLAEHLARVQLSAAVETLILTANSVCPFRAPTVSLLPDVTQDRDALQQALERIAARLGSQHVLQPVLLEDARPEWMQQWVPFDTPVQAQAAQGDGQPHPTFLLSSPLQLAVRCNRPLYQGELRLLLGPHRVEGGWWHRVPQPDGTLAGLHVARDYWVAQSAHAGVLWVFQTRQVGQQADDAPAWFLHGVFA
jgi:protein ImuB